MHKFTRLALLALAVTAAVAAFSTSAFASRLSTTEQFFRITWNDLDFSEGLIACDVTLEGSFHSRTLRKVPKALIGVVSGGSVGECGGVGSARILRETFPWHITYEGFTGTLPNITSIRTLLVNASFLIIVDFFVDYDCLYRSTVTNPARGIINVSAGTATGLRADEATQIPLFRRLAESTSNCPSEGEFSGTGAISPTIRISLI